MIVLALAVAGLLVAQPPGSHDSPPLAATKREPASMREAGLRGLVYDQGRWVSPDEIVSRETADQRLNRIRADYKIRRDRAPGTAEGQRTLALWCEQVGLKAESLAHFLVVTRLDPADIDAPQRLGMRFDNGSWRSEAEIAAETLEAEAQSRADLFWTPKFATWRKWLVDPQHKDEAVKALAEVRDPRAIPSLRRSFRDDDSWEQTWTVRLLDRIDAPKSSQILAEVSVFGVDEQVRIAALRKLVGRDPRTFVGLLINWLHQPIRYEVGTKGAAEVLRVEGTSSIVERFYRPVISNGSTNLPNGRNAASDAMSAMNQGMLRAIRDRERGDVQALERANYLINRTNLRVERTLKGVTGVDLGSDPQPWTVWWTGELGYYYESPKPPEPKPVVEEHVSVVYTPPPPPPPAAPLHHSCFGAGTPVLTRMGVRPIEDLRVGDQVLTQIPTSGQLSFRPILTIFHNKPTATLRVELEDETIVATGIHRFWKAGEGWTMARDLQTGDRVRTLGVPSEVVKVVRDQVQPVYNLEVADGHSFFVGQCRALVHDNSLVIPTTAPFDALPVAVKTKN